MSVAPRGKATHDEVGSIAAIGRRRVDDNSALVATEKSARSAIGPPQRSHGRGIDPRRPARRDKRNLDRRAVSRATPRDVRGALSPAFLFARCPATPRRRSLSPAQRKRERRQGGKASHGPDARWAPTCGDRLAPADDDGPAQPAKAAQQNSARCHHRAGSDT